MGISLLYRSFITSHSQQCYRSLSAPINWITFWQEPNMRAPLRSLNGSLRWKQCHQLWLVAYSLWSLIKKICQGYDNTSLTSQQCFPSLEVPIKCFTFWLKPNLRPHLQALNGSVLRWKQGHTLWPTADVHSLWVWPKWIWKHSYGHLSPDINIIVL